MRILLSVTCAGAVTCVGALVGAGAARADALHALQLLREGGCGGTLPAALPLHHSERLDRAAEQWAAGRSLEAATRQSGYDAEITEAVQLSGPESTLVEALRRSGCRKLLDGALKDVGQYRRGADSWLLLTAPYEVPGGSQAPLLAQRALQLINDARAHGARCGNREFKPAPPVKLSSTLAGAAQGHAADMALYDYFEHLDRDGRSPADRVRATGYRETLVGENIAYGPKSAEEVVQGWLDSPGHCENIMDPRFAEMGIAYAAGRASRHGLYWVQVLAAPGA
jgi:uncharacterized protein YkwD